MHCLIQLLFTKLMLTAAKCSLIKPLKHFKALCFGTYMFKCGAWGFYFFVITLRLFDFKNA